MNSKLTQQKDPLGNGLVAPLVRTGSDFATASGVPLVENCVNNIFAVRKGELPWRPDFGMDLEEYRHRSLTPALAVAAGDEASRGLIEYEPRVEVLRVQTESLGSTLRVKLSWHISSTALTGSGSGAQLGPITTEVPL